MDYRQNDQTFIEYEDHKTDNTSASKEENQMEITEFISRKIKQYNSKKRIRTKKVMTIFDATSKAVQIKFA